jgi:Flp pilus assembly protein protease CpaA
MGAGDVKLLGAIGAWSGWFGAVWVLILGSMIGGVLSLWALARLHVERAQVARDVLVSTPSGALLVLAPSPRPRHRGVPFGVALALAGAMVTFAGLGR